VATLNQILTNTFGVKAISALDPGIIKLADIRSGYYPGVGDVQITPQIETLSLQGKIQDPLAGYLSPEEHSFINEGFPKLLLAGFGAASGAGVVTSGLGSYATKVNTPTVKPYNPGAPMSFADGDSGGFDFSNIFSDISKVLQGGLGQNLLGIGTNALSGYVTSQFAPQPVSMIGPSSLAAVPMIGRGMAVVGRAFFNRFPNLATAIQGFINRGIPVTRSKLYGLLKRFGADFLISGGILTAAAVSELAVAGPGRRRMNPGNVKALRKAHRRMKAFHHICATNDTLLHRRRPAAKQIRSTGQTITAVRA
jgi:hypothetical protein